MRSFIKAILFTSLAALFATPLAAQQSSCTHYSIIIGSPEDQLMLAVNGTEDASAKIAALEKFAQEHPNSDYAPCVDQLLTKNYTKLQQYDKAIAAGQKAIAANRLDVPFVEDLLQGYVASGNASDQAFAIMIKVAPEVKSETAITRSATQTAAESEQEQKSALQQAQSDTAYMVYALLNLLPRVPEPSKQIQILDQFTQAYPELPNQQAASVDYRYAVAYAQAGQSARSDEYVEKAIAADPNNVEALNLAAFDYAFRLPAKRPAAAEYAQKAIALTAAMKKPEGVSDQQFQAQQNNQQGMAYLTLGYLDLVKNADSHRVGGAVQDLTKAAGLLEGNPELQGQAYYFLGFSYESLYPAEHRKALAALEQCVKLQSSMQGRARELLAKVRRVAR